MGQPRPSYLSIEESKIPGGGAVPITRSDDGMRIFSNNDIVNASVYNQSRHQSSHRSNLRMFQEV